jgi:hypothetical protein
VCKQESGWQVPINWLHCREKLYVYVCREKYVTSLLLVGWSIYIASMERNGCLRLYMSSTTTKEKMIIKQLLGECSDWNALHNTFVTIRTTSGGLKRSMTHIWLYIDFNQWRVNRKPNYFWLTGYSKQYHIGGVAMSFSET